MIGIIGIMYSILFFTIWMNFWVWTNIKYLVSWWIWILCFLIPYLLAYLTVKLFFNDKEENSTLMSCTSLNNKLNPIPSQIYWAEFN